MLQLPISETVLMSGSVLQEARGTVAPSETLADGQVRFRIRIIEGDTQGSSAYYPASVLERDGAKTFPKGMHMHIDHQSFFEFFEKPAGSLNDLAGVFETDPVFEDNGLYTNVKTFSKWGPLLKEMAPYIGVSIRAAAITEEGPSPIDGEMTEIVTELIAGISVDFVTHPGANGRIVEVMESHQNLLPEGAKLVTNHPAIEAGTNGMKGKPMAELSDETAKALNESIMALNVVVAGLATTVGEAAKPATPVNESDDKKDKVDPITLAFAASKALTEAKLSAKSQERVETAVRAGTPLVDAIEAEKALIAEVLAEAGTPAGLHVVGQGQTPAPANGADNVFGLMEFDSKLTDSFFGKVAG